MISFANNYRGGSSLIRIGELSEKTGLHINTLRSYADSGQIRSYRTLGGHRVFSEKEVLADLGWCENEGEEERRPVIYARVSSKKQDTAGNLDRQKERLKEYVRENEQEEAFIVEDVASAFGERRGMNHLIDLVATSGSR